MSKKGSLNLYTYLESIINDNILPGIVISIVRKNSREIFFTGKIDKENAVSAETIYDLASVTKVVGTTTAILRLIEDGYFNLNTKIKDLLPRYKHNSTVEDFLTHQSGLPADDKEYRNCKNKEEFIDFIYKLDLVYIPNEKVVYSDFGFNLLGLIIEKFKGNIDEYLQNTVFKPLQMVSTSYYPKSLNQELIAPTELHPDRGLIKAEVMDGKAFLLAGLSGNAGMFSNVNDLSNFTSMILNNGEFLSQKILNPETVILLKKSYTDNLDVNRTLGWAKKDDSFSQGSLSGNNIIYHTGFSGPMMLIDFDNEIGIVCLTNRTFPSRNEKRIIEERNTLIDNIYKYLK